MNDELKHYLNKCNPAALDQSSLDDLRRAMQQAVPEISESIRQREELAAELRIAAATPRQSNSDGPD